MSSPSSAAAATARVAAAGRRQRASHDDRQPIDDDEVSTLLASVNSRSRRFACEACGAAIGSEPQSCPRCGAELGYVSDHRAVRVVDVGADSVTYRAGGDPRHFWRCLNAAWGCNWMVDVEGGGIWCRSCALTRGRPDAGRPAAMEAWMAAERAKRRVIRQLDQLGLRFEPRSASTPSGLAFDLVYVPDERVVTGHLDGIVTLDLAEVDDGHRHSVRRQLDERFRTVVGHLRHEIGHYYWDTLVGQSDDLAEFRALFGDERVDYSVSMDAHYDSGHADWDTDRHITAYAASHPLEDWAETFAHHLHLIDMLDESVDWGLVDDSSAQRGDGGFVAVLDRMIPVIHAVNGIADTIGSPPVYPFEPAGAVVDKLDFVHRRIGAHAERNRFYAAP